MPKTDTKSKTKTSTNSISSSHTRIKKSLAAGRPPLLSSSSTNNPKATLSSRATRTLIRSHHTLQKRLAAARASNDVALTSQLEAELAANGGLSSYQHASTLGQTASRGGDSSRVLVSWLLGLSSINTTRAGGKSGRGSGRPGGEQVQEQDLQILEVGALSITNALNVLPGVKVRRIDLRSRMKGIEEVDFMNLSVPSHLVSPTVSKPRPSPSTSPPPLAEGEGRENEEEEKWWEKGYDIISLSLVLNYVPDPRVRGDMLQRTTEFLRPSTSPSSSASSSSSSVLPCLFLVLPLPCVANSRYLDEERLGALMGSLGYSLTRLKRSAKLFYSLWTYRASASSSSSSGDKLVERHGGGAAGPVVFNKEEVRGGKQRNNFCIVLR